MVDRDQRIQAFPGYPDESRIWIFQTLEPLTDTQLSDLTSAFGTFLGQWRAHQQPVRASAALLMSHFLVIVADERSAAVSGCAGDALHQAVHGVGSLLDRDFFDRLPVPVWMENRLKFLSRTEITLGLEEGQFGSDLLVFDHTVQNQNLGAWRREWVRPLSDTWLAPRGSAIPGPAPVRGC
jgi:hypothetical protein